MATIVDACEFGVVPNTRADSTSAVRALLEGRCAGGNVELRLAQGTYHFWPDLAAEVMCWVSNHDNVGPRRVAFPLVGLTNVTVNAQGSSFILHGLMTPFVLEACHAARLTGFTVDWERPRYSQGVIEAASRAAIDVRIPAEYPHEVRAGGRLVLLGEGWAEPLMDWGALMEWDPATKRCAPGSGDCPLGVHGPELVARELEPGLVRLSGPISRVPTVGNVLLMRNGLRDNPGVFVSDSASVSVDDVTIHHCSGMGFIAQNSSDIRLSRFNVALEPGTNRVFTAVADATHFVNCHGQVTVEDCLFENQLDDALNMHGIYTKVVASPSRTSLIVRLAHPQQAGVATGAPGDVARVLARGTLLPRFEATLTGYRALNSTHTILDFDSELPAHVQAGDVVENLTRTPNLLMTGCTCRDNRARGMLLGTPGEVVIRGNVFSSPGTAILIETEAEYWCESGAVTDVTIEGNAFTECCYVSDWGSAVIAVTPGVSGRTSADPCFEGRVAVIDNTFRTSETCLLKANSVSELVFVGNGSAPTGTYGPQGGQHDEALVTNCGTVRIEPATKGRA